jgi:hypothetical protein
LISFPGRGAARSGALQTRDPAFSLSSWPGKSAKRVFALDVPAIYVFGRARDKDVDARVKPAHDDGAETAMADLDHD